LPLGKSCRPFHLAIIADNSRTRTQYRVCLDVGRDSATILSRSVQVWDFWAMVVRWWCLCPSPTVRFHRLQDQVKRSKLSHFPRNRQGQMGETGSPGFLVLWTICQHHRLRDVDFGRFRNCDRSDRNVYRCCMLLDSARGRYLVGHNVRLSAA
jgi:hypothetical protein